MSENYIYFYFFCTKKSLSTHQLQQDVLPLIYHTLVITVSWTENAKIFDNNHKSQMNIVVFVNFEYFNRLFVTKKCHFPSSF